MPDRDTAKTQSWDMKHDETWKLTTEQDNRHTSVETEPRPRHNKNSSGDEIANVNFYAMRPGSYRNSLK